jgi:hypothetical protein
LTSKEQFLSGLQNLSSLHKIGWRSAEKNRPFFNMYLLVVRFLWNLSLARLRVKECLPKKFLGHLVSSLVVYCESGPYEGYGPDGFRFLPLVQVNPQINADLESIL